MEQVTEKIVNIGVNDRELRLFEGQYAVPKGMAYNSYVILDEKIAVMDTVDPRATKEWLAELENVLQGREVDYLVVQHIEPDHGGSIKELVYRFPKMKLVGNSKTFAMMSQFFEMDIENKKMIVKEGDILELGTHTLQFFLAPMVHWPEVMVTYEPSQKVIFSADAFGKFGTKDAEENWVDEARRYYVNICGKYGVQVQKLLQKLSGLEIEKICPLHGPVLTENLSYYIEKYNIWSSYCPEEEGVLIACASIHGNTMAAAQKMKQILEQQGIQNVVLMDLCRQDLSLAVSNAFRYSHLVLAAASYDAGLFPPMEKFLSHLKSKNFQNRTVALIENGSWGIVAGKIMKDIVSSMKNMVIIEPIVTIKSVLKECDIPKLQQLALQFISKVINLSV